MPPGSGRYTRSIGDSSSLDLVNDSAGLRALLDRAQAQILDSAPPDPTCALARQIATIGLLRMHVLQEHLGLEPNAILSVAPDATPSSNPRRCQAGFASGTRYSWESARAWLPVGFGPNACGITVVGLDHLPSTGITMARISDLVRAGLRLDGLDVELDFGRKNHFVGVFEAVEPGVFPYPAVAVLHCSAPELKRRSEVRNVSVVPDPAKVRRLDSVVGPVDYLVDGAAEAFFDEFRRAARFASAKRLLLAEAIFPGGAVLSNRMHQGYAGMSEVALGSHVDDSLGGPYAYLCGLEDDSFLYRPRGELSADAERVAVLPHGAGARYEFLRDSDVRTDENGEMVLEMRTKTGGVLRTRHSGDLPYAYKGSETFAAFLSANQHDVVARLRPRYSART